MSVLNPRNRLVNFRVSEQELELLKQACLKQGARSLSEFARNAVLESLQDRPSTASVEEIDHRVGRLESHVEQLLHLLAATGFVMSQDHPPALVRKPAAG